MTTKTAADTFVDAQDISVRPGAQQPVCALRNSQICSITRAAQSAFGLSPEQALALAASVGYENAEQLLADLLAERTRCEQALPDDDASEEYRLYRVRGQFCDQAASRLRERMARGSRRSVRA